MTDLECIEFREANTSDAKRLTAIAFAAKLYWNYPKEYYEIWHDEMTITEAYILNNQVYIAVCSDEILGFSSVVEVINPSYVNDVYIKKGFWLDHLFIDPQYLNKGIGTKLIEYTQKYCREKGILELLIFSEPLARGFYEKNGAKFMYETLTSIQGRMLPVYCLPVSKNKKQ
jgi:maltose O-acetyltransferase